MCFTRVPALVSAVIWFTAGVGDVVGVNGVVAVPAIGVENNLRLLVVLIGVAPRTMDCILWSH